MSIIILLHAHLILPLCVQQTGHHRNGLAAAGLPAPPWALHPESSDQHDRQAPAREPRLLLAVELPQGGGCAIAAGSATTYCNPCTTATGDGINTTADAAAATLTPQHQQSGGPLTASATESQQPRRVPSLKHMAAASVHAAAAAAVADGSGSGSNVRSLQQLAAAQLTQSRLWL